MWSKRQMNGFFCPDKKKGWWIQWYNNCQDRPAQKKFLSWTGWPAGWMAKWKMAVNQGKSGLRGHPTKEKMEKLRAAGAPRGWKGQKWRAAGAPQGEKCKTGPKGPFFPPKPCFFGPKGKFWQENGVLVWFSIGFPYVPLCFLGFSMVSYCTEARGALFFSKNGVTFFVFFRRFYCSQRHHSAKPWYSLVSYCTTPKPFFCPNLFFVRTKKRLHLSFASHCLRN